MVAEASQYLQSSRVGDVTVTAITEGIMPWTPELTVPEAVWRQEIDVDAEGTVPIDTHVLVVQFDDATILIDAGLDDPGSRWDERFLKEWPGSVRSPGMEAGLASMGVTPEDVTHILITHVHFDHVIGLATEGDERLVPRYPNARVLLGRADWGNGPAKHLAPESRARIRAIEEAGLLELVDAEREVMPGVRMIPAPGESPGHSMIRVSSNGEVLYAVGDLFHHRSEIEHQDWMVPWADQEQMLAARRRVLADVASTVLLGCGGVNATDVIPSREVHVRARGLCGPKVGSHLVPRPHEARWLTDTRIAGRSGQPIEAFLEVPHEGMPTTHYVGAG